MSSRWQRVVAVAMGIFWTWSANAIAQDLSTLTITAGNFNQTGLIEVFKNAEDLMALQLSLTPISNDVAVDQVTIGFGRADRDETLGNESFLDSMQVRLIDDTDADGVVDATEDVLGVETLTELKDPARVTFHLSTPLVISSIPATLLVILDINTAKTQAVQLNRASRLAKASALTSSLSSGAWIASSLLGWMIYRPRANKIWQRTATLLCFIVTCGVLIIGCSSDDENQLSFVVNLPSNGIENQDIPLGPVTPIPGITVHLFDS